MKGYKLYKIVLLLLGHGFLQNTFAQLPKNLKFETYTMKNGLGNTMVRSITQDSYGFIWAGTNNGVCRFDGNKFINYSNTGDSNSIRNNIIETVKADSFGRVWIGNDGGLCYYNYPTNNFIYISIGGKEIKWVFSMAMDKKNYLWYYSNLGFCRTDTRTMRSEIVPGTLPFQGLCIIFIDRFDVACAGICKNDSFIYIKTANKKISNNTLFKIPACWENHYYDTEGDTWLTNSSGFNTGLKKIDITTGKLTTFFPGSQEPNNPANNFSGVWKYPLLTGDSILWCNTAKELFLFNHKTNEFIASFKNRPGQETSLPPEALGIHFIDRDNNLWIGGGSGLIKMNPNNQEILSYPVTEIIQKKIPALIRKIVPHKKEAGVYWLVTFGAGIIKYNFTTEKIIKQYKFREGDINPDDMWNFDALYDKDGKLWVAGGIGLSYYNDKKDKFSNITFLPADNDNTILKIAEGNHNDLWLATAQGLWTYNKLTRNFKYTDGLNKNITAVTHENKAEVFFLKFLKNGRLAAGTKRGLNIIDTLTGSCEYIERSENHGITASKNYIWGIDADTENNLWIASNGGYIWKYNTVDKTFTDFDFHNGLTTPSCRDIFVDTLGNTWASSRDGVFKLSKGSNRFTHFTTEDGLYRIDQGQGRWSIIDNKIYAGYDGAFSVIDIYHAKKNKTAFPVWISGMKIFDTPVYFSPDSSAINSINLNYTQNFLTFEFTAIEFTQPDKVNFYFKLDGFDKDWINAGNRRFATYTNLEGGEYTFMVKAINGDGIWSNKIASFKFYVTPAFWKTWWFRLIAISLITAVITFLIRQRIKTIKKEAAFKQKITETEMMALQTQMNPHFIFNSLNSIENYMMRNEKLVASNYLNKFARLIRIILESSRDQLIPFSKDIEAIQLYIELELLRFNNHFIFNISISPELENGDYRVPPLLIQPFVENAIIHGLAPSEKNKLRLSIAVKTAGENIHYCITDNGIGRKQSGIYNNQNKPEHKSIGLDITRERLAIFNEQHRADASVIISDLYDEKNIAEGTKVDLFIKAL